MASMHGRPRPDRIDESKELDEAVTWTLGEDENPAVDSQHRRWCDSCPDLNVAERAHGPWFLDRAPAKCWGSPVGSTLRGGLMELAREVTGTEKGVRGFCDRGPTRLCRSIVAGGGHNAVRVMTVTRPRLAFPVTIVVVGDNKAREVKGHVPVVLDPAVGMDLPAALLKVSDMKDTALNDVAEAELDAALLDQLNIVYVAMTRPVERLDVLAETAKLNLTAPIPRRSVSGFLRARRHFWQVVPFERGCHSSRPRMTEDRWTLRSKNPLQRPW